VFIWNKMQDQDLKEEGSNNKGREMRWSPEEAHKGDKREPSICFPPSSLFIWFAYLLLFLLDSVIALEAITFSLFHSFSYSGSL
jgi:hypothetical protein